jgi:predicted aminopeptidase
VSRWARIVAVALALGLLAFAASPLGRYLLQAGRGQATLMLGAEPIAEALQRPDLDEEQRRKLRLVGEIKAFGEQQIGLKPSTNYSTVNLDFHQVVWNVSACPPDRFESHVYRYPIVGDLPYIGFFSRDGADAEAAKLQALGWETWVRSAGAYSTLGWFQDPLWGSMLEWGDARLANTILHELAHATVWVPGHGKFNESLATFVGDEAERRWLSEPGEERAALRREKQGRTADGEQYRTFLHELYGQIEGLYEAGFAPEERERLRRELIADARRRYASLSWNSEGYARALRSDRTLNNPGLKQFRVYHTGGDAFDEALARFGGDLPAFLTALQTLPKAKRKGGRDWDPYEALDQLEPAGG